MISIITPLIFKLDISDTANAFRKSLPSSPDERQSPDDQQGAQYLNCFSPLTPPSFSFFYHLRMKVNTEEEERYKVEVDQKERDRRERRKRGRSKRGSRSKRRKREKKERRMMMEGRRPCTKLGGPTK